MTTPTSATTASIRPSLRDRLRRERYLLALSIWMDDVPAKERRPVLSQLRGGLDAAAADTSMREAVSGLGPARLLAAEYRALQDPGLPRWTFGGSVALGWLLFCLVATAVFASALWQVAPAAGGSATARLLGAEITITNSEQAASLEWSGFPWAWVVALALFLVAARAWRLAPALRRRAAGARAD
ncbi:hypothetical protein GCM10023169_06370 [Georgenia halophila]|uniref:DUF1707 domain-containing protein n=1 Tax=Georgenia halophila TaxID=620889 RepID=A0ABP8KVP3_9MICO